MMFLKNKTNVLVAKLRQPFFGKLTRIGSHQADRAGGCSIERARDMQKRTFSRSAGSQHRQVVSAVKFNRNPVKDPQRTRGGIKLFDEIGCEKICHVTVLQT